MPLSVSEFVKRWKINALSESSGAQSHFNNLFEMKRGWYAKAAVLECFRNLRLVQSIPSPQAEPFKRWLARVGRAPEGDRWPVAGFEPDQRTVAEAWAQQ